jgi:hypothetical protein
LKPRITREFLNNYGDNAVPREDIAYNVLEDMGVPKDRTRAVLEMILSGAESVGFLSEIKGKKYVNLQGVTPPTQPSDEEQEEVIEVPNGTGTKLTPDKPQPPITPKPGSETRLARVFISHGKNRVFVEPIKQLLEMVQLHAVVSVESSTVSQPVTQKVMNDMRSSGAAIIHVDSEQKLIDPTDAKEVVTLNPNVMIEIGAAMALYGERYILLVREGVKLPSNLQGKAFSCPKIRDFRVFNVPKSGYLKSPPSQTEGGAPSTSTPRTRRSGHPSLRKSCQLTSTCSELTFASDPRPNGTAGPSHGRWGAARSG